MFRAVARCKYSEKTARINVKLSRSNSNKPWVKPFGKGHLCCGWQGPLYGQHFRRAAVAEPQIRGGLSQHLASVAEAKVGIGSWLGFYNEERQHQSLGYRTPRQSYEAECRWICGPSASPTDCAFAHIPTGTTNRIDVEEEDYRSDVMTIGPSAIGAGIKIGGVTP
jgi:hypothetical protein